MRALPSRRPKSLKNALDCGYFAARVRNASSVGSQDFELRSARSSRLVSLWESRRQASLETAEERSVHAMKASMAAAEKRTAKRLAAAKRAKKKLANWAEANQAARSICNS